MLSEEGDEVDFCLMLRNKNLSSVWPQKSVFVIEEIINTEQTYVTDLESIVKGYMEPFSHQPWAKSSVDGDLTITIFGNVSDLLFIHRSLLKDMLYYSKQPADYADVFLQHENNFNHYKEYCKNLPSALHMLQDCMDNDVEISNFLLKCQQKMKHIMPLQSLLIKPVQRVLKYHLLLASITKELTPNFQGFTNLCKAHTAMMKVAADINETQRLYEASVKIKEIESCLVGWKGKKLSTYGNVLLEDFLKVIGFKGLRYVIVFEKLLLLLKKVPKDNVKYHYKGHIEGNEVSVMATPISNHPFCFKVFSIANRDHYFLLETKNEDDKMKWMATLVSLIENDLCLPNNMLTKTSVLPPTVTLPDHDAAGSRKRPRSSQEDEGAPGLKQREALSDQSNIANDIGPDPVVIKRHYAVKKKTSGQADKIADDPQAGINNASISDVIPQEGPMDDELLEYTKLQDENTRVTPAAEQSQHGTLQRSDATMDDDEYSFARAQSVALGVDDVEQDEQKGSNHLLRQREEFKSMDIDIEKRFTSSLHHWDDIANLAELKDEGTFDESKTTDDVPTSGDSVAKKPKHTVPYRESVVSASSLESVILDEHCNLRSAQSSNRSSLVDVEDVLFEFTEPVMSTITEEVDCVLDEEHAVNEDTKEVVATDDYCGETSLDQKMGGDEVDFHFQQPASLPPSFDTGHMKSSNLLKSQSSESDSEEEHDIDPSIHDSPMFASLPCSHSNVDDKDHSVDDKVDDMFVTASGRFIAPTSTLPRMRRSMNSVGVSPLLLSSTPDSPSVSAALARKRFRLVSKSTEVCSDDETQSTGAYKEDDEEVMLHTQDDLSTSSLPCTPLKLQRSQSMRATKSHLMIKRSPRRGLRRSGGHSDIISIPSPPASLKTEGQFDSFVIKNLVPAFDGIRGNTGDVTSESNTGSVSMTTVQKGSCDATQPMSNMDIGTSELGHVDNPPLSSAETFQFSASMVTHSTTATANNDTSANMTSTEGSLVTNNTSVEDEMFSTPDNHGSVPLIQPLSQSPHVPGKTPHAVMTQSKLFAATSATDDATVTQSPRDVDLAKINDALSQTAASTKVKDNVNVINKTDDSTTGQHDVEKSVDHTTEQLSAGSVGVVEKENVDVSTAVSSSGKVDKGLVTTTATTTDTGSSDISGTTYVQLDAAALVKEQIEVNSSEMSSSDALPSLVIPETTEGTSKTILKVESDRSDTASFDSLSPLVLSLAKSSVLQQVVDSDKSAQFPVTPEPFGPYKTSTPPAPLPDQITKATGSASPSKTPQEFTHLQAPSDKRYSRRRQPNDPYALSPQAGRLVRSLEYTPTTDTNSETPGHRSPATLSPTPSSKHSRSLGDVTPKLKSVSVPSSPATDVSFELPLENVVLQGRVSSLSMSDQHTSHNTAKPMLSSNTEYSPDGKVIIDKIYGVDDDDDFEHDETSPLISKEQHRQPKTRQHLRSRYLVASGHSYNSAEDTQPLLEEGEEGDEDNVPKTSWFCNVSIRSVVSYLVNLGSGIGNLLLYYISEVFHPRAVPTNIEPTNTEPANSRNNRIN